MSILSACVTQWANLCGIRRNFYEPNRCIAVEAPKATVNASGSRKATIKQWQPLNLSAIHYHGCVDWIDPA
jgi:hypothetical protein